MDEVAAWVRDNIQHSVVFFVVDDLNYLKRGGRLSGASAFFGSMLDIKPIIYASPEGALVPIEKCKGRRKALRRFVELYEERALDKENGKLYITESNEGGCCGPPGYVPGEVPQYGNRDLDGGSGNRGPCGTRSAGAILLRNQAVSCYRRLEEFPRRLLFGAGLNGIR